MIKLGIQIKILLMSFALTVVLSIVIIPILRKLKIGQIERDDGPQSHLKKVGTPTMGGIIIIISILVISIVLSVFFSKYDNIMKIDIKRFLLIVVISIGFGAIGFVDDFKKLVLENTVGLKPAFKMLGLLLISVIYVLFIISEVQNVNYTYIPLIKKYFVIPMVIYIPFAIFVILGTTNAINLTDGVDGLSSSICIIIISLLTILGMRFKVYEISLLGVIVIGAILGFLIFNLYPAKIMMGDTGSLFLGGIIAIMALYLKVPLLIPIIAIIPVIETVSVMIQVKYFQKTGNRIFKMAPLHHHFELCGWKENKVVIIFSLITLVSCIVTLQVL